MLELIAGNSDSLWVIFGVALCLFFLGVVLAHTAHVSKLTGRTFSARDLFSGAAWPTRTFLLLSVVVGATLAALFLLYLWLVVSDKISGAMTLYGTAFLAVTYACFICRFGTLFPAAAIENRLSLADANTRGREVM